MDEITLSRGKNLIADLEYTQDVLNCSRTYSPVYFKDQEFLRVIGNIIDKSMNNEDHTLELSYLAGRLEDSIFNAMDSLHKLDMALKLLRELLPEKDQPKEVLKALDNIQRNANDIFTVLKDMRDEPVNIREEIEKC